MKYITKNEVAAMLRVSVRTITSYTSKGLLPRPKRLGRKLLWDENALVQFMQTPVPAPAPLTSKPAGPAKRGRPRKITV
jgi:predicted DNA-binding transcriptional regulator AlpA